MQEAELEQIPGSLQQGAENKKAAGSAKALCLLPISSASVYFLLITVYCLLASS